MTHFSIAVRYELSREKSGKHLLLHALIASLSCGFATIAFAQTTRPAIRINKANLLPSRGIDTAAPDPDELRSRTRFGRTALPIKPRSELSPDQALDKLLKSLIELDARTTAAGAPKALDSYIVSLQGVVATQWPLSTSEFCVKSRGINDVLDRLDSASSATSAAALLDVCMLAPAYSARHRPDLHVPDSVTDPATARQRISNRIDVAIKPAAPQTNEKRAGAECAEVFVQTADMYPNQFPLSAFMDPSSPYPSLPRLEEGQRIGAKSTCPEPVWTRYSASIKLKYKGKEVVLSPFVNEVFKVPALPDDLIAGEELFANATLTVQTVKQVWDGTAMNYANLGEPKTTIISVLRNGAYCSVKSKFTDFTINDRIENIAAEEWESNTIKKISGKAVTTGAKFQAYAFVPEFYKEFWGPPINMALDMVKSSYGKYSVISDGGI